MKRTLLSLFTLTISTVWLLHAQEKTADAEKLGKVHFPVSCGQAAQPQIDRAAVMLHCIGLILDHESWALGLQDRRIGLPVGLQPASEANEVDRKNPQGWQVSPL